MLKKRLPAKDFNFYLKQARYDIASLNIIYTYCTEIIREHIHYKYGKNNFYNTVPHDVFTRIAFEFLPKKFINAPVSYLCRATQNYMIDIFNLKDNQTLELTDNYPYFPEYENSIEFINEEFQKEWYKLDKLTRYIIYLDICLDYKLKEIADMLGLRADYVRTKKSRAIRTLEKQKERF